MEDDPATREVKLAVPPKALNPMACVPKPRLPTPSDTLVQRAEFVKNMHAYLARQGPRVTAPPIRKIIKFPDDQTADNVRSPEKGTEDVHSCRTCEARLAHPGTDLQTQTSYKDTLYQIGLGSEII